MMNEQFEHAMQALVCMLKFTEEYPNHRNTPEHGSDEYHDIYPFALRVYTYKCVYQFLVVNQNFYCFKPSRCKIKSDFRFIDLSHP